MRQDDSTPRNDLRAAPQSRLNRRQFLAIGAGAAAAFTLPHPAQAAGRAGKKGKRLMKSPVLKPTMLKTFPQPPVACPGTSSFPTKLAVDCIKDPTTNVVTNRYYTCNDQGPFVPNSSQPLRPGPTFRFQASDPLQNTLHLNFVNNLPVNGSDVIPSQPPSPTTGCEGSVDRPRCFNTVNLHFHGFHVSPISLNKDGQPVCGAESKNAALSSDDMLFFLPPEGQDGSTGKHRYCVKLPTFHAAGTHWYHAHNHGSTALHIVDGMAGALIVEEEGDAVIPVDEDLVWLLQEIIGDTGTVTTLPVDAAGTKKSVPVDQLVYNCAPGGKNPEFTVNGYYQPTLTLRPGELQRWRFINGTATPRGFIRLQLVKNDPDELKCVNMNQIAIDGISFFGKSPKSVTHFDMVAANRSDFLIQLDEPGTYQVLKQKLISRGNSPFIGGGKPGPGPQPFQVLATIKVEGDPIPPAQRKSIPTTIPGTAPHYLEPVKEEQLLKTAAGSTYVRPIVFDITGGSGCFIYDNASGAPAAYKSAMPSPRLFQINGKPYSENSTDKTPRYTPPTFPSTTPAPYQPGTFSAPKAEPETVQVVKLNTAEEWIVYNYTNLIHPFHIHVNPFQVVEVYSPNESSTPQKFDVEDRVWWDTFGIPPAKYDSNGKLLEAGYFKMRTRFWDYWGEYVFHCHILIHEDLGMMQNVYVQNDGTGHGPCVPVTESPDPTGETCTIGQACSLPSSCYPNLDGKFVPNGSFPEQIETTCVGGKTCEISSAGGRF